MAAVTSIQSHPQQSYSKGDVSGFFVAGRLNVTLKHTIYVAF